MVSKDRSEQVPTTKPGENTEFQDYLQKLRESGLEVIDTTKPGTTEVFVGGMRKPKE